MKSNLLTAFISTVLTIAAPAGAAGQNLDDNMRANLYKSDAHYICGEGYGDSYSEAAQMAMQNLLTNIGTVVDNSFSMIDEETSVDGKIEAKSQMKSIVNSYSQAALSNTETIQWRDKKGGYYFMRYMNRSELDKMFAQRRDRIEDYVRSALRSEERGKVNDALRFLNWAYVLLHSLQYPGEAKMDIGGEPRLLVNWIPGKITEMLDDVSVAVADIDEGDGSVDVFFNYKGKPATGLDFSYWNGKSDSELNSVKDGLGHLTFPDGGTPQEIALAIETSYRDASQCDRELEMLINNFKPLKFREAQKTIGMEGKKIKVEKQARTAFQQQVAAGKREGITPLDKKEAKEYDRILSEVLASVKDKNYRPDAEKFTGDGLEMFNRLLRYGNATILGNPEPGYYTFGERVVARSVPMKFSFRNNRRSFVEDVTFTFSPEKKIESVAFGLGSSARKDIFEQGVGAWSDSVKMVIVTFLENYKTAFALKRLDYINSIFDENAYIIVGHKLEQMKRTGGDGLGFSMMPKYEYARKSKEEYMKQLKKCFDSNEFVNINFADNDVQKSAYGGDTFGIQIKQDYHSEHYGDQGYLFLFVDLNDADKPVIKIRTWQPDRNPDLTPMLPKSNRDYGIYSNSLLR